MMKIAILGVGEAGRTVSHDLIMAGVEVHGWDPQPHQLPEGLLFAENNTAAVANAELVLSTNWASVAIEVAQEVAPILSKDHLYADLNTSSPQMKKEVAAIIEQTGAHFVDAAFMAPVPPKGIKTPVYASGLGALTFAEKLSPLGMPITVLDNQPGSAATHKLVRSIFYKGLANVVMECLEAAQKLDLENYARQQMMTLLNDEAMIDRFVQGSHKHADRRIHEMEAVVALLDSIGVASFSSQASIAKLNDVKAQKFLK